jgi:hypothetical protein
VGPAGRAPGKRQSVATTAAESSTDRAERDCEDQKTSPTFQLLSPSPSRVLLLSISSAAGNGGPTCAAPALEAAEEEERPRRPQFHQPPISQRAENNRPSQRMELTLFLNVDRSTARLQLRQAECFFN